MHIYPVELEDDGTYQCQASPTNDGQPALRSRFAKLSVLVPPQKPKILQGDFLITTEDRELVIECVSIAGKPPAEVRFFVFQFRVLILIDESIYVTHLSGVIGFSYKLVPVTLAKRNASI